MKCNKTSVVCAIAICILVCAATSSPGATIVKLSLSNVGPDVGMTAGGILSTVSDGNAATTGDQNTNIEFTDFFNAIPDINSGDASFTLSGLTTTGVPSVFGTLVLQSFNGGTLSLFDPSNVLLLSANLTNSQLSGTLGPPGTGSVFTTTLGSFTGGTLAPSLVPGSFGMSMQLIQVNGGSGFGVGPGPVLLPFSADGSLNLIGEAIPEPSSLILVAIATVAMLRARRRSRS
jgi:hypothetical protein